MIPFAAAQLVPFFVNRTIRKVEFANISWESTKTNIKPSSWAWDNDPFHTNQFAHPYHGSIFYNSFRSSGYNFWQSAGGAAAGSYLWETFAEKQAPAPNDFINTTFGGVVLGEMTHRLSNKIINNHTGGFKRQAAEVAGFIINPAGGLNRILDGKWGKVTSNTLQDDSSKITAEFDVGYRKFNATSQSLFGGSAQSGWYAHAKLLYGTPSEGFRVPFSNIVINAEVGKDDSTAINMVTVYGSLTGWQLNNAEEVKQLLVLSANYDYIHTAAFFYGGQSVKANLYSEFKPIKDIQINTTVGMGPILLAAVPAAYLAAGRNYDYGVGFGVNGGGKICYKDRLAFTANYNGGWTRTVNGNHSNYFLHTVSGEVSYRMVGNLHAMAQSGYYGLEGNYQDKPELDRRYPYLKIAARLALNIK
ncbi:hypothetical protein GCM10028827_34560 [Mucilaginibacter myungsuensis]